MRPAYSPHHAWRIVLVALMALLLLANRAAAQDGSEPISLREYRLRLDRIIQELESPSAGPIDSALDRARSELDAITAVTLPSGETIEVRSPLPASLFSADALARLNLLRDQLAAAENDQTAVRLARLRAILERPQFAARGESPSLLARVLRWLADLLPDDLLGLPVGVASTVGLVVIVTGLLVIAILVSYWLQGLLRSFVASAEARRRQGDGTAEPLTATAARQQASELAQAGSYRQAMRQLYLAALLRLDEVGVLRYDRSQTNREVLAQLPSASVAHGHLAPVVDTFDRIWYGVREPDQDTYAAYAAEVDRLTTTVEPVETEDRAAVKP